MHTGMSLLLALRQRLVSQVVTTWVISTLLITTLAPSFASAANSGLQIEPVAAGIQGSNRPLDPPGKALRPILKNLDEITSQSLRRIDAGMEFSAEQGKIQNLTAELAAEQHRLQAEFAATEAWIREAGLPELIQSRHQAAAQRLNQEIEQLLDELGALVSESSVPAWQKGLGRAQEVLQRGHAEPVGRPFNPEQLPHQVQQPNPAVQPRTSRDALLTAGLHDTPLLQLAAVSPFNFADLPEASNPAYLQETSEIGLTPRIRALAAELNYDPVAIYHYVRNEIFWLPTWGATQSADMTLTARQGNAKDISSLLIALLRASGIPARYVHGTVDLPEAQFRNWIGGFNKIEEALQFAQSGRIPVAGIVRGGQIAEVRLEHVWVEAAIDFLPSRGARMFSADTWLPLEASFKQYVLLPGLDAVALLAEESERLVQELQQHGSGDRYTGMSFAAVVDLENQASQTLINYIDSLENPTVGDVLGGRRTVLREAPVLPANLPYLNVSEGLRYGSLPDALQHQIQFNFGSGQKSAVLPWASVNNQRLSLGFEPATVADAEAMAALIPDDLSAGLAAFPDSIPAYLFEVVPVLRLGSEVILSGSPATLGTAVDFNFSMTEPGSSKRHYANRIVAGSYLAVIANGHTVSVQDLRDVQQRIQATEVTLATGTPEEVAGLDREAMMGDLFHGTLLTYFAFNQGLARSLTRGQGSHVQATLAVGSFGYRPHAKYLFGVPVEVSLGGLVMDIDRMGFVSSTDGAGRDTWRGLNFQLGAMSSALEHLVPETLFSAVGVDSQGVSTISALTQALQADQDIFRITRANHDLLLPELGLSDAISKEIASAVAVGLEAIVHGNPIQIGSWHGSGYIVLDPLTGAAAWKISGGLNGGYLSEIAASILKPFAILSTISSTLGKLSTRLEQHGDYSAIGDLKTVIGQLGHYFNLVSATVTAGEMYAETESFLRTTFIFVLDLTIAYGSGKAGVALYTAIPVAANPVGAAVVVSLFVGVTAAMFMTRAKKVVADF